MISKVLDWLCGLDILRIPKPEITVTPDDVDPRRLNISVTVPEIVINPTHIVIFDDYSIGVYEKDCLIASSPVIVYA